MTMDEIGETVHMPVKVVMKHIARLQQAGLIEIRESRLGSRASHYAKEAALRHLGQRVAKVTLQFVHGRDHRARALKSA